MDCIVSNDSDNVQCLLDLYTKPLFDQIPDVIIYVFSGLSQIDTQLLNTEPQ